MPNTIIVSLIVFEISAFIRTEVWTDMAKSTRLVTLIVSETVPSTCYILSDEILVYPFTLRVKGMARSTRLVIPNIK